MTESTPTESTLFMEQGAILDLIAGMTEVLRKHLGERGIEWDLKPMLDEAGMPVMAYCPLGEGRLLQDATLAVLAERHGVTPASIALAWLLTRNQTIAIPKTSRAERIDPIMAALDVQLDAEDLALLDDEFPPADGPSALAIV